MGGKEIFCLFKEPSGSYRQEGKGFVEGNEIPDEQIIGKMENAYGAHVLVKMRQDGNRKDLLWIMLPLKIFCFILLRETRCDKNERIIVKGLLLKDLYNVKGFARQYVIVILAMAVWGVCMKNISFMSIYMVILGGMMSITTMSMDESNGFNKFYLTTCEE